MATKLNRLSARAVQTLAKPGKHADGGNLYLAVSASGAKSWLFVYRQGERQREMGLGSVQSVPLARARELAAAARQVLADGKDPLSVKRQGGRLTFGEMADLHVKTMETAWRNPKHRAQWHLALEHHAAAIRSIPVADVTTEDVLRVLNPMWRAKPDTASRLRGRIEAVLDAAKAKGIREGENPARWRGHLDNLLPRPPKLSRGHHAAMDYAAVPDFITKLRGRRSTSARGLEFAILTAARSGEVLGMRWGEVDLEFKLWTVPASRMKGNRDHRVPLSEPAIAILKGMASPRAEGHVFPGAIVGKPMSNMSFEMLLRRLKVDVTTHGFRSSFRDWVGEETEFPRELAEAALAHLVGDETERAYRRGDALQKRRLLMEAWAGYCDGAAAEGAAINLSRLASARR